MILSYGGIDIIHLDYNAGHRAIVMEQLAWLEGSIIFVRIMDAAFSSHAEDTRPKGGQWWHGRGLMRPRD